MDYPGNLFVVAAPAVLANPASSRHCWSWTLASAPSIFTPRALPRGQEKHGPRVLFASQSEFDAMVQANAFVEWAHAWQPIRHVQKAIEERIAQRGRCDSGDRLPGRIAGQAGLQQRSVGFHPSPAGKNSARAWSAGRRFGQETIELRLKNAAIEMAEVDKFDFVIINELFESALSI